MHKAGLYRRNIQSRAVRLRVTIMRGARSIYLLWQLPGIACLKEDNGSLGWSGFGNGCNGFGRGCNGSTRGEAKNGPPRCEANAKAWNCCCCPKRDSTAINRAPVRLDPRYNTYQSSVSSYAIIFFLENEKSQIFYLRAHEFSPMRKRYVEIKFIYVFSRSMQKISFIYWENDIRTDTTK